MSTKPFFDRYLSGKHIEVWYELFELGESVQEEQYLDDAIAVTKETMARVLFNVELLIKRLRSLGYMFGVFPDGRQKVYGYSGPHTSPNQDAGQNIAKLENLPGILKFPLSLKFFWEIVGEVNFIGYYPSLPAFSDPLVVYSYELIQYEYKLWKEKVEDGDIEAGEFSVSISPDYLHKSNVSGGEPYKILLPNGSIDAKLENEGHETTFINYLRKAFQLGGFPGLDLASQPLPKEISTEGFKPF